jgi:hypothetical protein
MLLFQQPFDLTPHIDVMTDGWSIGNGCDELFTDWMTTTSIETNGHVLEVMNGSLTINGCIYENGIEMDVVDLLSNGKIMLSCVESSISVLTNCQTLDVDDHEIDFEVTKVFPNPFTDHITVKGENIKKISLFDLNGKSMFNKKTNAITTLMNLTDLSSGLYLLKVDFTNRDSEIIKIIKNNL